MATDYAVSGLIDLTLIKSLMLLILTFLRHYYFIRGIPRLPATAYVAELNSSDGVFGT